AIEAGVRLVAGLVTGIGRFVRAVATGEAHQQLARVDELIARVVGRGVDAGVHADRVARASFHAEAAEHAAQLVDHEALREALVAAARIAFRVFAGFDVDALRRAGRGAAQAGHAARRAVGPVREPVHA